MEVQGKYEKFFGLRMFTYFSLIEYKHTCKITSWAILADTNNKFVPTVYKEDYLGTVLNCKFKMYKIINKDENTLRKSDNPFATVVLTVLTALKKGKIDELERLDLTMDIVKDLLGKNYPKDKISNILRFWRNYVRFNSDIQPIFVYEFDSITNNTKPMGLLELMVQDGVAKGVGKGVAKELKCIGKSV